MVSSGRLLYKKWPHHNLNNGFTSKKFALNKRTLDRKSVSTRRNEAFDKKSNFTSRKSCFHCLELKKPKKKKKGLHLISRMVSTSRKKL